MIGYDIEFLKPGPGEGEFQENTEGGFPQVPAEAALRGSLKLKPGLVTRLHLVCSKPWPCSDRRER